MKTSPRRSSAARSTQIQIFDARFRYLATSVWIPAVLFLVLAVISWVLLSKTVLGRHLYALGGNEEAARLSGVRIDRMKWFAYCASAVLSSIAGIIYICEVSVAEPQTLGRGYELNSIAAAVVGGCSLQGGVGTVPGTVLGALFLRVVIDGVAKIIKTGADVYEGLIVGVVVVFAVAFSQTEGRRHRVPFFAGGLGFVAAINLSLIAGTMAVLIGPTLAGTEDVAGGALSGDLDGSVDLRAPDVCAQWSYRDRVAVLSPSVWRRRSWRCFGASIVAYRRIGFTAATSLVRSLGGKINDRLGRRRFRRSVRDRPRRRFAESRSSTACGRCPTFSSCPWLERKSPTAESPPSEALTTLKRLDLTGTNVSRSEKTMLGRSLPDLEILDSDRS